MRADRAMSWFKRGVQVDARISGDKFGHRIKHNLTVFSYGNDRRDAINAVVIEANRYGYSNVTIDKLKVYK